VVRVFFWNAGNTPIEAAKDILKPFTITISGDSEILDAVVLKVSRDITFITLDAQEDKRNKAIVNFDILESNDGAALQIAYAGPNDAKLEFDGVTIGAPSPTVIVMTDYSQYSQKISDSLLLFGKMVRRIKFLFLWLGVILSSPIFIPFVRNVIYRSLFRSKKTDREIEVSTMRVLLPAIIVLFFNGVVLIQLVPPPKSLEQYLQR
jgi:hypothetical protein